MLAISMELKIIIAFCCILLSCILCNLPLLLALVAGLILFLGYGLYRKITITRLLAFCLKGILTVRNILLTFILIGMLTASWRACGTIPMIVTLAANVISPATFILTTFLLNGMVSFLIGTSFGTVATMGVICISIAQTLQLNCFWVTGAIISGIYFGDRCSPVSTSALLVATLTKTDIYTNIKLMLKSCLVPFLLACSIYYYVGQENIAVGQSIDIRAIFQDSFVLNYFCVLPALAILTLALMHINVKVTMSISIAVAILTGLLVQNLTPIKIAHTLIFGYTAPTAELGKLLNGGGVLSMVKVFCIVCIASCYAGIFKGTGLLDSLQEQIKTLSSRIGNLATLIIVSVLTSMLACNQTLAIMLTHQLAQKLGLSDQNLAIDLEDTAVVISPLIPWNIAVAVPLAIIAMEPICILGACYLYLLPLWRLLSSRLSMV